MKHVQHEALCIAALALLGCRAAHELEHDAWTEPSIMTGHQRRMAGAGLARRQSRAPDQVGASSPFLDAIGLWYIDQYSASPRPHIPNAASAVPVSANLIGPPRNMFTMTEWWACTSCVDRAATAPDGTTSASSITAAGNWFAGPNASGNTPAGTYTLACYVKRNTGSDQQFTFYRDYGTTRSAIKTATATWQRFTYTFTSAAPFATSSIGMNSIDGVTGASILISDFEMYAGSSDLGPSTCDGHLYFGTSAWITAPPYASGELNMSALGRYGVAQFAAPKTLATFTAQALVTTVATSTSYRSILGDAHDYRNILFTTEALGGWFNFGRWSPGTQFSGLWQAIDKGYHVMTLRYDGTYFDAWVDDVLIRRQEQVFAATTVADLLFNIQNSISAYAETKYAGALALWDRALTDAEVRDAVARQQQRAALSGITATTIDRILIAEGDSITGGNVYGDGEHGSDHPYVFGPNADPPLFGIDYALSFSRIEELNERAAAVDAALPPARGGRKFILSVMIGANDLGGLGASAWLTNLAAYLDARRAAGWTVALGTVLPLPDEDFETERAIANAALRTWVGTHCDYLYDFAADPTIGPYAAASDTNLYPDGIHPSMEVQETYMEPIYRAVINEI